MPTIGLLVIHIHLPHSLSLKQKKEFVKIIAEPLT